MSNNPNDITAKFYDIASSHFKAESLSLEELEIIKKICKTNDKILDIGCGTGRHLIPLVQNGFALTGIDLSKGMLNILRSKDNKKAKVIEGNFLNYKFEKNEKFNLIILFWNTFNEICLTISDSIKLLNRCKRILAPDGKILINSDDAQNINPQKFDYSTKDIIDGNKIVYTWKTFKFKKRTNTSISEENVNVNSSQNYKTLITQRWWTTEQYYKLAKTAGFLLKRLKVKQNDELYLLLTPTKSR